MRIPKTYEVVGGLSTSALLLALAGAWVGIPDSAFAQGAASFQGVGDLPGGSRSSLAYGVSADGLVVVGDSNSASSNVEAFRWTQAGGIVALGDLPGGTFESTARAASADGSVIVGQSNSASGLEAFRWTSGTGMVGLGDLPGGAFDSAALGVSADGSVVVGGGKPGFFDPEAFRWTQAGGMVGLGDLYPTNDGVSVLSWARAVSGNGTIVVGGAEAAGGEEAFRWTSGGGMVGLPFGNGDGDAGDVSSDGLTVVGEGRTVLGREAFRWTSGGGMAGLGDLPDGFFRSEALGVSADGSVVVGTGSTALGDRAFIWDSVNGMRDLRTVLINDFGLNVELINWTLFSAKGISDDGLTIVGHGSGPFGAEGWVAHLGAIDDCNNNGTPDSLEPDSDGDGVIDDCDQCPGYDDNTWDPATDTDGDGTPDCNDECPNDPNKVDPGFCGCGVPDDDTDGDGALDCDEDCPNDPDKLDPGDCGCGVPDTGVNIIDFDGDGVPSCIDVCTGSDDNLDADGDGVPDGCDRCPGQDDKLDADGDRTPDCIDGCPNDPNKIEPGICGCGTPDTDTDIDGTPDCNDGCPNDPWKAAPGVCGCGVPDDDTDGDGTPDCVDDCPLNPNKTDPGVCGCDVSDIDTDQDIRPDCIDNCPLDPEKFEPGICGCGHAETGDGDNDGVFDCVEDDGPNDGDANSDGVPDSQQANVASLPNVNGDNVTVTAPDGTTLSGVTSTGNPSPGDAPEGVDFPAGFIGLTVQGLSEPGAAIQVRLVVDLPAGEVINTYWKYGPTPDDPTPHWYEFMFDGTTGAEINGNVVTLHLVDGQRGDHDLTANGQIDDPGSPGFSASGSQPWPGCFCGLGLCGLGSLTTLPLLMLGLVFMKIRPVENRRKRSALHH